MRTRRAHIRATAADGREWRLTWCPETGTFIGRPLHSRTSYTLSGSVLVQVMSERGKKATAAPKEDPRQMMFA